VALPTPLGRTPPLQQVANLVAGGKSGSAVTMADVAGGPAPRVAHRFYHVPASNTAVGHLILENSRP
jgi:hypothetical protein